MRNELQALIDYLEEERKIPRAKSIQVIENCVKSTLKLPQSDIRVSIDQRNGKIQVFATLTVVKEKTNDDEILIADAKNISPDAVVGGTIEVDVTPSDFGRIFMQSVNGKIKADLNKVEKSVCIEELAKKCGEIINVAVKKRDKRTGDLIVAYKSVTGHLSVKEQIPREKLAEGDNVDVLLRSVDRENLTIDIARASADYVKYLFEREVSEIREGLVEIRAIVREAGSRTKIAVHSYDTRIDPVGSCVGIHGTRVHNITDALGQERVDIVPYSDDIRKFTASALSPAKVNSVLVSEAKKIVLVRVASEQASAVFGKNAQNVRMAAKLLGGGWSVKIELLKDNSVDAKVQEQAAKEGAGKQIQQQKQACAYKLAEQTGMTITTAKLLVSNGYLSTEEMLDDGAEADIVRRISGINVDEVKMAIAKLKA